MLQQRTTFLLLSLTIILLGLRQAVCDCHYNRYPEVFDYSLCNASNPTDYCLLELHINSTTKEPTFVERLCSIHNGGLFALPCESIVVHDDLIETCCKPELCNLCPGQEVIDEVGPQNVEALFDLFPDECRGNQTQNKTNVTVPIVTPITRISTISITTSSISLTHSTSVLVTSKPTSATPTPSIMVSSPISTYNYVPIYIFLGTVAVVFGICLIVFVGLILLLCYTRKGRRRRIVRANDPPFTTNPGFGEMTEVSSSGLFNNKLLSNRTWAHDFKLTSLIGKGRLGSVHIGSNGISKIAVKVYSSYHEVEWEREVSIFTQPLLNDPFIVKYLFSDRINHEVGSFELWTGLEYHANGNLQDYLRQRSSKRITLMEAYTLSTSFLSGLSFLHRFLTSGQDTKPGIAHRDLKSPNVLVKADGNTCIADLGLAVIQKGQEVDVIPQNKLSGTKRYLAPEILDQTMDFERFQSYVNADIYAASLIIWEIFNCCTNSAVGYEQPFYEHVTSVPEVEDMKRVVVKEKIRPSLKRFNDDEDLVFLSKLLSEAWSENSMARPSAWNINKKIRSILDSKIH